jgi:hypothetical protein
VSDLVFLRTAAVKKIVTIFFNHHIRILLINAVPMIYICCIKYVGRVGICVLTVRDNGLDVRDDELNVGEWEVASSGGCRVTEAQETQSRSRVIRRLPRLPREEL